MISFYDKLLEWDRPFKPASLPDGSKALARRASASQIDELEAFYADEYARLVVKTTETQGDKESELDRVRGIFRGRTRQETLDRIIETRVQEIQQRALRLLDAEIPPKQRDAEMEALKDKPDELEKYQSTVMELYAPFRDQAEASVRADYDDRSNDELVDLAAQISVNIGAINKASHKRNVRRLLYTLFDEDKNPAFESLEQVEALQPDTINRILQCIEFAFLPKEEDADLPFASPADPEPAGPQPSPSNSEADLTDGGPPTPLP